MLFDRAAAGVVYVALLACCGFPRPPLITDDSGVVDDARLTDDARASVDGTSVPVCTANDALRCEGGTLVKCNADGTAEETQSCALGCNPTLLRCDDVNPSNGLAPYLDMTASESDVDFGTLATINTDDGTVIVDGAQIAVRSATLTQSSAPTVRVFIVRSLTAAGVKVTGKNAVAFVSNGDIKIGGVFAASGAVGVAGSGGLNDGTCKGGNTVIISRGFSGSGGGGFAFSGGKGGSASNINGTAIGGAAGTATGNVTLIPLRGGCDSGTFDGSVFGGGGGAIQLVSRTRISVIGVVAANGKSISGGGSGGGILLEAPSVEVSGAAVANGGSGNGGNCIFTPSGEDGRLDATPAAGGAPCGEGAAASGNGGAGNSGAGNGSSITVSDSTLVSAGHGGGSVGRIRVNTAPNGIHTTGLISPNPSTGNLATR